MEIWKTVSDFPKYEVSSLGEIRNKKSGYILKPNYEEKVRYYRIKLFGIKHQKTLLLHRIIAKEFCDNPMKKAFVNHIDGNKLNNVASNLEWCTKSENALHSYRIGLASKVGEKNNQAKINELQVRVIRRSAKDFSVGEISKMFGVNRNSVYNVINRKTWSHI